MVNSVDEGVLNAICRILAAEGYQLEPGRYTGFLP